jgi:hypothetical protein
MATTDLLKAYAQEIRTLLRANPLAPETALAPSFQRLIEALAAASEFGAGLTVVPEFNAAGAGRPDIALIRQGEPPRAFIELKAPAKSSDPTRWRQHDRTQYERLKELANWATSNFTSVRLFRYGDEQLNADIVPERALNPDTPDARANALIDAHATTAIENWARELFVAAGRQPAAADARALARLLAHSARFVSGTLQDRLTQLPQVPNLALSQVREEFQAVLYAHPEAGGYNNDDFNALFSGAFAQTLAFGLLLARESNGAAVGPNAWEVMPP